MLLLPAITETRRTAENKFDSMLKGVEAAKKETQEVAAYLVSDKSKAVAQRNAERNRALAAKLITW